MIRPRLELRRDTEIGAEEATAELSNKFFARAISPFLRIARQVTSDAMFRRRPVGRLMAEDGRVSGSIRSEEHTSELQSLMRISYAVFCLKKKNKTNKRTQNK